MSFPPSLCSTPQVGEQHRHDLSSMRHEIVGLVFPAYSAALRDGGRLLTAHPASTGARFRLLHLVLRYCQAQQAAARGKPCPLPIVLLYEQVGGWVDGWFFGGMMGLWIGLPSLHLWQCAPACLMHLSIGLLNASSPAHRCWRRGCSGLSCPRHGMMPSTPCCGRWLGLANAELSLHASTCWSCSTCYAVALRTLHPTCCREALGAVRDFGSALEAAHVPQLPRDLPPPHPVWGAVQPPNSNAARQSLLIMLLSAGERMDGVGGWLGQQAAGHVPWAAAHTAQASHDPC